MNPLDIIFGVQAIDDIITGPQKKRNAKLSKQYDAEQYMEKHRRADTIQGVGDVKSDLLQAVSRKVNYE